MNWNELLPLLESMGYRIGLYCECNHDHQREQFFEGMDIWYAAGWRHLWLGVLPDDEGRETYKQVYAKYPDALIHPVAKINQATGEPRLIETGTTPEEANDRLLKWLRNLHEAPEGFGIDLEQAYRDIIAGTVGWSWSMLRDFALYVDEYVGTIYPTFSSKPDESWRRWMFTAAMSYAGPLLVFDNVSVNGPGNADNKNFADGHDYLRGMFSEVAIMAYLFGDYWPQTPAGVFACLRIAAQRGVKTVVFNPGLSDWVNAAQGVCS